MPKGLSELQKQILNILEDHGGYTNRGFISHKIWPSLYPHTFKIWDIPHSLLPERSIQKRITAITLRKSLKGLEKRGLVKLGSFYPYSVTSPKLEILLSGDKTNASRTLVEDLRII